MRRRSGPAHLVTAAQQRGVTDERLLQAIRDTPRAGFVPPDQVGAAYDDRPVVIPHGQTTSQPSLIAEMVAELGLDGDERVLEVGTGYGWQTALLARLAREVYSIERFADLAETARDNLQRAGITNAWVVVGDGTEGLVEHAPYDGIIVSAAFTRVPDPLATQLADGGRLVMPVGSGGHEEVTSFERDGQALRPLRRLVGARFVRLVGRHGFPEG